MPLEHRNFSAWITCENYELVEFEPMTDSVNNKVVCWIVGPIGKNFVIHWRDHGTGVDSASYIYFDGYKVPGQFLYGNGHELRRGVRVGPEEERPFVFSRVDANDPKGFNGEQPHKNIGSIIVEIKQVKRVGDHGPSRIRTPPEVVRGNRPEGEVAVKYGEQRPSAAQQSTFKIEPHDKKNPGPYVTFVFRYRTRDWLTTQGIMNSEENAFRAPRELPPNPQRALHTPPQTPAVGPHDSSQGPVIIQLPATASFASVRSTSGAWEPSVVQGEIEALPWDNFDPANTPWDYN